MKNSQLYDHRRGVHEVCLQAAFPGQPDQWSRRSQSRRAGTFAKRNDPCIPRWHDPGVLAVFIRPQTKRAKTRKKFIEDLQKGSRIVTIAGIHGVINKVNEDGTLTIETSPSSYLKIEKSAISMDWTAALNKKPEPPRKNN